MKINVSNLGMPCLWLPPKLLLIMRLIIVILTTCFMQVSASIYAQRVTLKETNMPVAQVLKKIKQQTGYDFLYEDKVLAAAKNISIDLNNVALAAALDKIFEGQNLAYAIGDGTVIVKPKEPTFLERVADRWAAIDARGKVSDENGSPLEGATIVLKGTNRTTKTDAKGEFVIANVPDDAILIIRYVGYKQLEIPLKGAVMPLEIKLNPVTGQLEEVAVKGSTGYQVIDKNHPGSFDVIDNELVNRTMGTNVLSRIEDLTPGVLFNRTIGTSSSNQLLIRGRNTINSNTYPLIVLDNFPYDGDINNINPNDIESFTILKDASAAAIWGARAGNGVIVITTKQGKTAKPQVSLRSNIMINEKPDQFYASRISSSDFIEIERDLFNQGRYNALISATRLPQPLTPVIEILAKQRQGQLTATEANAQIDALRNQDVRSDLDKYFYQTAVNKDNHLSVSGNTSGISYYLSGGWSKGIPNYKGDAQTDRINLKTKNRFKVNNKVNIDVGITYTRNLTRAGNGVNTIAPAATKSPYPYADLVDDQGNGLTLVKDYRSVFADTVGRGKLLDMKYRPYDEINTKDYKTLTNDFLINTGFRYQILSFISAEVDYQFENQVYGSEDLTKIEDYSMRLLINRYYQPNAINPYPVPLGGRIVINNTNSISHQARAVLNLNHTIGKHRLSGLVGWEIKHLGVKGNYHTLYGYKEDGGTIVSSIDFVTRFPQNPYLPRGGYIANSQTVLGTTDRFISSYADVIYNYDERYVFNGSIREDAANLFGVKTNMRGTPLWSIGANWQIANEKFYGIPWLPRLNLKASYGYSGNINRNAVAFPIIGMYGDNPTGVTASTLQNPPNEGLRWERNGKLNLGLDFSLIRGIIEGNIDYYISNNKDLVAQAPIDGTLGLFPYSEPYLTSNVAAVNGKGLEFNILIKNIDREFKWTTNWVFSYASTKVAKYLMPQSTRASDYLSGGFSNIVIVDKPLHSWYAYHWTGLDPTTGDPQGQLENKISKDYNKLVNVAPEELVYFGPSIPPYSGSIRNTVQWKALQLSFNITSRFGYYVRRQSVSYNTFFDNWTGHSDYALRWQNPGDEQHTSVPSAKFPEEFNRSSFYNNSAVLMQKGDHIRLQDIQLSYSLIKREGLRLPFRRLIVNSNLSNLNVLLWKASKHGIDPDLGNFPYSRRPGKIWSVGLNLVF